MRAKAAFKDPNRICISSGQNVTRTFLGVQSIFASDLSLASDSRNGGRVGCRFCLSANHHPEPAIGNRWLNSAG
jgi:hypothetical protein